VNIFRKHQKAMLVFMFVGIGIPMLFFGLPSFTGGGNPNYDVELASVGGVPIMASDFRRALSATARRQARGGDVPTYKELAEQGTAAEVLEQMMTSALIGSMEAEQGFDVEQSFLEERLKDDSSFKDEAGNFNGARFNAWVKGSPNMDWDAIYEDIREQASRQVFMSSRIAGANRVLDKDVQQELLDSTTKIQMEYLKVEPTVEPTEEEIQKQYESNPAVYQKPPTYTADYVAFSLKPDGPNEKVTKALERAKAGEDFAALADEVSELATKNGGDLGWLSEPDNPLDTRKALFSLPVGGVSDPIQGPNGYYIYKAEEERNNEENQQREVKARQIYINVALSDEERAARTAKAEALAAALREQHTAPEEATDELPEENYLRAAAAESNLTVSTASGFSVESTEIEGIENVDAFQFRRNIDEEAGRGSAPEYNVITGRDNLYVAQVLSRADGDVPPLSDIRTQVIDDARTAKKTTDEYKEVTAEFADKIVAMATTLDEANAKFPELKAQIKETRPFTKREYLFQDQIYLQTTEIYDALDGRPEKEIAGPLTDFLGGTYFIALTKRIEPTDEEKADWDEQGKSIRDRLLATARYELTQDFTSDLQERYLGDGATGAVAIDLNPEVYDAIVSIGGDEEEEAGVDAPAAADDIVTTVEVPVPDVAAEETK
jgi:hypothetical protein